MIEKENPPADREQPALRVAFVLPRGLSREEIKAEHLRIAREADKRECAR